MTKQALQDVTAFARLGIEERRRLGRSLIEHQGLRRPPDHSAALVVAKFARREFTGRREDH